MSDFRYNFSYFIQVFVFSIFWVWKLKRKNRFSLRLLTFTVASIALIFLITYLQSLISIDNWLIFSMPYMLMMAFFGVGLWFLFDVTVDTVLLTLLLPTTMQLCGDALGNIILYYVDLGDEFYVYDLISTLIMCLVSLGLVRLYNRICFYDKTTYTLINILCYSIVLCIFLLNAFTRSIEGKFTRLVVIAGYRFFMGAFIVFIIFLISGFGGLRYQKRLTEVLLQKEEQQHTLAKELSEFVNIKYHDIKHMETTDNVKEFINQDERLLDLYGCLIDCGNPALNTILTEKNIICKNNKIDFTILVNGEILNFMSSVDIYSLFGNAIDNAIECLKELPVEERHVKLLVKNVGNMVSITCENACHKELKFTNGLPQTTKNDVDNHGFGTKSIANICKKYSAEFKMTVGGGVFILNVLIPSAKYNRKLN